MNNNFNNIDPKDPKYVPTNQQKTNPYVQNPQSFSNTQQLGGVNNAQSQTRATQQFNTQNNVQNNPNPYYNAPNMNFNNINPYNQGGQTPNYNNVNTYNQGTPTPNFNNANPYAQANITPNYNNTNTYVQGTHMPNYNNANPYNQTPQMPNYINPINNGQIIGGGYNNGYGNMNNAAYANRAAKVDPSTVQIENPESNSAATASLVFGIISIVSVFLCGFGAPVWQILAIVFCGKSRRLAAPNRASVRSKIGKIFGISTLPIACLELLIFLIAFVIELAYLPLYL